MTKELIMQEVFWDLIITGIKKDEFRKQSKGLVSGKYLVKSTEKYCDHCGMSLTDAMVDKSAELQEHGTRMYFHKIHKGYKPNGWHFRRKKLGWVKIKTKATNVSLFRCKGKCGSKNYEGEWVNCFMHEGNIDINEDAKPGFGYFVLDEVNEIDELTYNFIKQNYENKHEYIVYEITEFELYDKTPELTVTEIKEFTNLMKRWYESESDEILIRNDEKVDEFFDDMENWKKLKYKNYAYSQKNSTLKNVFQNDAVWDIISEEVEDE